MTNYMTRRESFLFWVWLFSIPLACLKIGNILNCNSCTGPENLLLLLLTLVAWFSYIKFSFKFFFEAMPEWIRFFESNRDK